MMRNDLYRKIVSVLIVLLLLPGCGVSDTPQPLADLPEAASGGTSASSSPSSGTGAIPAEQLAPSSALPQREEPSKPDLTGNETVQNYYVCSVIDGALTQMITEGMSDYEKLLAVYRYLISEVSFFDEPVGTDLWRYRGDPQNTPTVFEVRSLSPLLFGIGSCEDYASAFVTLCDRMGFEARYVPGLTYSVEGELVPHAWAMVRLEGSWYHADPQLEDNIIKADQLLRYRYFLKSDDEMSADHRWGTLLKDPSEYALALPYCPNDYEATPPELLRQQPRPSREKIAKQVAREKAAYARSHPPLPDPPELVLPT